jgi:hypothetical protein
MAGSDSRKRLMRQSRLVHVLALNLLDLAPDRGQHLRELAAGQFRLAGSVAD